MMTIYRRGGRSDTRSGSYQVFQYKGIEPTRIFLHLSRVRVFYVRVQIFWIEFGYLNFEKINKLFIV